MEDDIHPWNHIFVNTQHMKRSGKMIQLDQPVTTHIMYVNQLWIYCCTYMKAIKIGDCIS